MSDLVDNTHDPLDPESCGPIPLEGLDPDTTGPLPTAALESQQADMADGASAAPQPAAPAPAADETAKVEPMSAPGRETLPVAQRADADVFTGENDFLSWGSRSDVGLVRDHNEDAMLVDPPVFCVCDGMGGHAAGEVASAIAVRTIQDRAPATADDVLLGAAVEQANTAVIEAAERGEGREGMGCTATVVQIEGARMAVAHVGDSRVYVLHSGTLVRITHDHSFVEELVDAGEITVGEARVHPSRSIITRALGSDPNMYADHFTLDVEIGDRIIICSDGLDSMVPDSQIEAIAVSSVTPQGAADKLVAEALAEGGHDNVTVVVVDVEDDGREILRRRTFSRILMHWIVGIVAVVALFAASAALYINNSWYLANNHGTVGIYQGVQGSFLGIPLSHLEQETTVDISDLPEATQTQIIQGIHVSSLDEATSAVEGYAKQIEREATKAAKAAADASSTEDTSKATPTTASVAGKGGE